MHPAQGIGKLGFRRWYERQLIQAHVYLVTAFLCIIVVAVLADQLSFRGAGFEPLLMLALILGALALGIHSWLRFRDIMLRAEGMAHGATCAKCDTYGRLKVLDAGSTQGDDPDERDPWMKVECRKCGYPWTIG